MTKRRSARQQAGALVRLLAGVWYVRWSDLRLEITGEKMVSVKLENEADQERLSVKNVRVSSSGIEFIADTPSIGWVAYWRIFPRPGRRSSAAVTLVSPLECRIVTEGQWIFDQGTAVKKIADHDIGPIDQLKGHWWSPVGRRQYSVSKSPAGWSVEAHNPAPLSVTDLRVGPRRLNFSVTDIETRNESHVSLVAGRDGKVYAEELSVSRLLRRREAIA